MAMPDTGLEPGDSVMDTEHVPRREPTRRVLVVGDDTQSFLTLARSLGREGLAVHAAPFSWHAISLLSRYIAKTHRLPRLQSDTEGWIAAVSALMEAHDYDLIIPCCERSLLPLWANRDRFPPGRIAAPGPKAMACLFDRLRTREVAAQCAVPVADGRVLTAADTGAGLIAELGAPVFIKARSSYTLANLLERGSVRRADTAAEADGILAGIGDRQACLAEAGFPSVAKGVGISVIARRGRVLQAFQHRRLREKTGGGANAIRVSEPLDADMLGACRRMAAATEFDGVAMFEFRRDIWTREWVLLEVNVRFWGPVGLAVAAGIDFPVALYRLKVDGMIDVPMHYRTGLVSANSLNAIDHLVADPDIRLAVKPFRVAAEAVRRGWHRLRRTQAVRDENGL